MRSFIISILIIFSGFYSFAQRVAINEDGSAPNNSALLDIKSTTKGLLIPRMNSAERIGIASPALGLLVYDNQTASFWYYKAAGWTELIAGGAGANSWSTNGADIYNSNAGNVGIGTTTPITKLTIQTPINSAGWVHIGGADSIIVSEGIGGVSAAIGTVTNHAFRLNSFGQGRLHIYPSGDIVVGSNNSASYGKFTVQTPNNSFGISHISDQGNILATNIGGTSAGIGTFSNTNMRIFSNSFSRIFVAAATGNVGIGIADDNPIYKLDVGSRMRIRSENASITAGIWFNNPANTAPISFMGVADAVTTGFYGNVAGWGLIMNTNTGNVGIGTINPTYKLSVNGDIRTKEVVVETGWADYVFDSAYKLNSLDEVEKFIEKNKHLPNIPSAKEVEENGLHVGDVQKRMMEKIEELTLYILELNNRIKKLEQNTPQK